MTTPAERFAALTRKEQERLRLADWSAKLAALAEQRARMG